MFLSTSISLIAGIDEAGRGALAGPVVAAAAILTEPLVRKRRTPFPCWSPRRLGKGVKIADSKVLTPEQRSISYEWIATHCAYGIGIVSQEIIERDGILRATELSMQEAVRRLRLRADPQFLLVDGRDRFRFDLPHISVIRGDQTEPCIAAASILAKVTRDRIMRRWGSLIPAFGFDKHKGYGTEEHCMRIKRHGPCPLHRRSFLANILSPPRQ
ncbi:MAG: ribonuclease HII [Candidatus Peribacteraceae bacterium]|nr:ribonuclease HII [Candidatus Peribacteraceae bacterium]